MFKKIMIYIGYLLVAALFAAYFFFASELVGRERDTIVYRELKVNVLDSAQNRFVNKADISTILTQEGIAINESRVKDINQHELENLFNNRTAIKVSQVSVTTQGTLKVDILQRKPILRLQTDNGGFYLDDSAYIFPLMNSFTSYVPIVTGEIPLDIPANYRGDLPDNAEWGHNMLELGLLLDKEEYWNTMIEQIYVDKKGRLLFTPRVGMVDIIFGKPENIEYKFTKLRTFYDKVIPAEGWDKYISVDLSFSNQLVCKKRDNKQSNI